MMPVSMVGRAARAVVSVASSRARHGRLRPTWSFGFEVMARILKETQRHVVTLPVPEQRAFWDSLARRSLVANEVDTIRGELAGRPSVTYASKRGVRDAEGFLYFHGGGYCSGSIRTHADLMTRIALESGLRVTGIDYRLAPENPFPVALDDARAAFHAFREALGPDARIVVGGDSAGGNLALALALSLRDEGAPLPTALALISPWVDLAARGGSLVDNEPFDWSEPEIFNRWSDEYRGDAPETAPLVSPSHADLRGLPPMLIHVGSAEMLFTQVSEFADRAQAAGVTVRFKVWPDMIHNFHTLAAFVPLAEEAIEDVGGFARARVATPRASVPPLESR